MFEKKVELNSASPL